MKNILIDTSAWVEYFKVSPTVAAMVHDRETNAACTLDKHFKIIDTALGPKVDMPGT